MKSPEELDDVDWAGSKGGESVPPLIEMLYGNQAHFDADQFFELESHIYNMGGVYPATVLAVPFLFHAALHSEFFPDLALSLLSRFTDLPVWAREVELEVRDAVVAEASELLPCLEFADPELRRLALRVLGGCAKSLDADRARVAAAVLEVFESDLDSDVAADALTALGQLEDEAVFVDRVEQAISETDPVVRLAGLLCALDAGYARDLAERAELVDEAGRLAATYAKDSFMPFPNLGTTQERVQKAFKALRIAQRDSA
jgi:hypothetical protein